MDLFCFMASWLPNSKQDTTCELRGLMKCLAALTWCLTTMNTFPDPPRLRERSREIRWPDANAGRGFVCILDLRRDRCKKESYPDGHILAWAALLVVVVLFAGIRAPENPSPPLHLDAAAMQLVSWESPTGFLLDFDFPNTKPN